MYPCSSNGCSDFVTITGACDYFFDFKFASPVSIGTWVSSLSCFANLDPGLSVVLPSVSGTTGYELQSVQCLKRNNSSCQCTAMDCLLTYDSDAYIYINSLTCDGSVEDSILGSLIRTSPNFTVSIESNCGKWQFAPTVSLSWL